MRNKLLIAVAVVVAKILTACPPATAGDLTLHYDRTFLNGRQRNIFSGSNQPTAETLDTFVAEYTRPIPGGKILSTRIGMDYKTSFAGVPDGLAGLYDERQHSFGFTVGVSVKFKRVF